MLLKGMLQAFFHLYSLVYCTQSKYSPYFMGTVTFGWKLTTARRTQELPAVQGRLQVWQRLLPVNFHEAGRDLIFFSSPSLSNLESLKTSMIGMRGNDEWGGPPEEEDLRRTTRLRRDEIRSHLASSQCYFFFFRSVSRAIYLLWHARWFMVSPAGQT